MAAKRAAAEHRGLDRLHQAVPASQQLYRSLAERGGKLASATRELLRLLELYGPRKLEQAIALFNERDADAEHGKHAGVFHANNAAAYDDEGLGQLRHEMYGTRHLEACQVRAAMLLEDLLA